MFHFPRSDIRPKGNEFEWTVWQLDGISVFARGTSLTRAAAERAVSTHEGNRALEYREASEQRDRSS